MATSFQAEEVIEIACRIERNGARFYREAAELSVPPDAREMLLMLAEMEDEHELVFEGLRGDPDLLSDLIGDPADDNARYLRAIADGQIFPLEREPAALLGEEPSVERVLRVALEMEKAAILYYQGLRTLLASSATKVDAIIAEEMRHVALLAEALAAGER